MRMSTAWSIATFCKTPVIGCCTEDFSETLLEKRH